MAKYSVPLTGYANICVTVETEETDPEKIAELAMEAAEPMLCHQCSDSRNQSLELGDGWEPGSQPPEVYREGD